MDDQHPPPAADHGGAATVDQVGVASGSSTVVQAGGDAKVEVNYGITLPVPPPVALAGLPPAEAAFTGRSTDLTVLADVLRPGAGDQPTVAAITGPPGIGTTTLALRAARDAVDAGWFPGGVLFRDLRGFARQSRVEPEAALAAQDERERARDCLLRATELLDGQPRQQDAARARALLDTLGR